MIVDTSAIIAILRNEPEATAFAHVLHSAETVSMSAPTLVETAVVARGQRARGLDHLLDALGVRVVAFTAEHARLARAAYVRYGKGSGSVARLNLGDCFSYALAQASGEPLLFKGEDFAHTDATPAR